MKVFISHTFAEDDQELALSLQKILSENKIEGYLAEKQKEYDLLIRDKIRKEIQKSDHMIAIVTNKAKESASVNQEIGYALREGILPIIMLEDNAKSGVLTHGIEPEEFSRENFERHCKNVCNFILKKGPRKIIPENGESSDEFLKMRNMNTDLYQLGTHRLSGYLSTRVKEKTKNGKSFVLFSACPKILNEKIDVHAADFLEWLEQQKTIKIDDVHQSTFLTGKKKINLDTVVYLDSPKGDGDYYKYFEFHENGFFEQGMTDPLVSSFAEGGEKYVMLHLCFTTGAFWVFLKFCRKYFEKINFQQEFDVMLTIHNTIDLMLMGFGGTIKGRKWAEPYSIHWNNELPKTEEYSIQLKINSINKDNLTDDFIAKKVKEFSDKISYAYGLEFSKCYNEDGTFNFNMFSYY